MQFYAKPAALSPAMRQLGLPSWPKAVGDIVLASGIAL